MGQTAARSLCTLGRTAAIMLLLALGACGGGGDNNGAPSVAPAAKSPVRLWGYAGSETSSADSLALVTFDPDKPGAGASAVVKRGALRGAPFPLPGGKYQAVDGSVSDYRTRALVFASGTGLFKLDLDKNGSAAALPLSAESAAQRACMRQEGESEFFQLGATDFTDFNRATAVYRTPGPDGLCQGDDDAWRAVKFGMGAGDQPIDIAGTPVAPIHDKASGALRGWLLIHRVIENVNGSQQEVRKLERVDADFANVVQIATLKNPARLVARVPNAGTFAGDALIASGDELRRFDVRTNQLSAPLTSVVADSRELLVVADATHAYVVRNGFGLEEILKVPLDGNGPTPLLDRVEGPIWDLQATATHLLYRLWDGSVRAVATDAQSAASARSNAADGEEARVSMTQNGIALTSRVLPANGQAERASTALVEATGSGAQMPNAQLIGYAQPVLRADGVRGRALLAEGVGANGSGYVDLAGAAIVSYDADLTANKLTLGALPRSSVEVSGLSASAGYGQLVTLTAVAVDHASGARYFDLYLAEADKAGALTRITRNIP